MSYVCVVQDYKVYMLCSTAYEVILAGFGEGVGALEELELLDSVVSRA